MFVAIMLTLVTLGSIAFHFWSPWWWTDVASNWGNIDSTIILQEPKLSSYIDEMKRNISNILEIDITQISIKATTTDKLGFIGSGNGLAVESICLIKNETK